MTTYILGNGSHGRMLREMVGGSCLGPEDDLPEDATDVFVGVGDPALRRKIWENNIGTEFSAFLMADFLDYGTVLGEAVHVMRGCIIMPGVTIGSNTLINTGAQIDHDCIIGDHCHIAPGVIMCGDVHVADGSFVGAGAILTQGARIDEGSFIPAGRLVVGGRRIDSRTSDVKVGEEGC